MTDLMEVYPYDYFYTFAGMIVTIIFAVLPDFAANWIIVGLLNLIFGQMLPEVVTFFVDHYIPEIKQVLKPVKVTFQDSIDILTAFFGMLIKMLWAFLWQEQFLTPAWAFKLIPLHVGAAITPYVMAFGSKIDGIEQTSDYMVRGEDVYPGWRHCNVKSDHALWHQISADALTDLVLVVDYAMGKLSH